MSLGAGQQEIPTVVLQHASVDTAGQHAWIAYSAGALCLQELPSIRYVSTKGPNSQRNQRPNMTMRRVCCFLSTPPPPTHTHNPLPLSCRIALQRGVIGPPSIWSVPHKSGVIDAFLGIASKLLRAA